MVAIQAKEVSEYHREKIPSYVRETIERARIIHGREGRKEEANCA